MDSVFHKSQSVNTVHHKCWSKLYPAKMKPVAPPSRNTIVFVLNGLRLKGKTVLWSDRSELFGNPSCRHFLLKKRETIQPVISPLVKSLPLWWFVGALVPLACAVYTSGKVPYRKVLSRWCFFTQGLANFSKMLNLTGFMTTAWLHSRGVITQHATFFRM